MFPFGLGDGELCEIILRCHTKSSSTLAPVTLSRFAPGSVKRTPKTRPTIKCLPGTTCCSDGMMNSRFCLSMWARFPIAPSSHPCLGQLSLPKLSLLRSPRGYFWGVPLSGFHHLKTRTRTGAERQKRLSMEKLAVPIHGLLCGSDTYVRYVYTYIHSIYIYIYIYNYYLLSLSLSLSLYVYIYIYIYARAPRDHRSSQSDQEPGRYSVGGHSKTPKGAAGCCCA